MHREQRSHNQTNHQRRYAYIRKRQSDNCAERECKIYPIDGMFIFNLCLNQRYFRCPSLINTQSVDRNVEL